MARLEELADELYGLRPDEFTAARNTLAKQAKPDDAALAAQVQALRKPSAAAWAVNAVARQRPDELVELVQLGSAMREAQDDLDRAALIELTKQRRQLVQAMARTAASVADELGQKLTASVLEEVAQTLQAALSSEIAGGAVLSGRLVRSLETVGTEVDVTDAVAAPGDLAIPVAPPKVKAKNNVVDLASHRALAEARKAVDDAEREAEDAESAVGDIDEAIDDVTTRRDALADELAKLQEQVADLEAHLRTLDRERRPLDRDREKADRVVEQQRRLVQRAQEHLAALGQNLG